MNYKKLYEDFLKAYDDCKDIIMAVYEQLGCDDEEEFFGIAQDVCTPGGCGGNAGFYGFVYHSETTSFWFNNRELIRGLMNKAIDEGIGYNSVIEMVSHFNCVKGHWNEDEIGIALYDCNEHENLTVLYDIFAKYALEEVAYWANDFEYDNRQD